MTRLLAFSVVLIVVIAPLAYPQTAPDGKAPGAVISTATNLVLVPVVVTDKHGSHISHLTRDDFRVEEDGKQQTISGFEEVTATSNPMRRAAVPQPNAFTNEVLGDPSSRVLVIIALDFLNTTFGDEASARSALLQYLAKSVHEGTLVSLVTIDTTGMHLIHDFTTDSAVLIAALKRVSSGPRRLDTNDQEASGQGQVSQQMAVLAEAEGLSSLVNPDLIRQKAQPDILNAAVAQARENLATQTTLEAFQHLAQAYSAVPGRKALIWATGSFPFFVNAPGDMIGNISPELYERTFQMLGNANVAVYPVDVRGLSPGGTSRFDPNRPRPISNSIVERGQALRGAGAPDEQSLRELSLATLRAFADMTGGQAFYNANDLAQLMGRATNDSSTYYLLSYYLNKDSAKKSGWHKLKVGVAPGGAQVRSRSGFFVSRATLDPEASRRMDEQVALDSPIDYTAMPLMLVWKEVQSGNKKNKASFNLMVAPQMVRIEDKKISVDFLGLAKNAKGEEVARFSQNVQNTLTPDGIRQIQSGGLTYANTLQLPPGNYNVRMVVRDNLTGMMGSVLAPLKVQ